MRQVFEKMVGLQLYEMEYRYPFQLGFRLAFSTEIPLILLVDNLQSGGDALIFVLFELSAFSISSKYQYPSSWTGDWLTQIWGYSLSLVGVKLPYSKVIWGSFNS